MKNMLHCSYHIAVPTAFFQNEELNIPATMQHILYLQKQGVSSVLVCGSTGEQHSLTLEEKLQLIEAIEHMDLPEDFEILFGVASIRQKEALLLAQAVNRTTKIAGALVGFPPYILPSQQEAKKYMYALASIIAKPIILYNNPKRTGFDLAIDSVNELIQIPQVIGLKEAGDYHRIAQVILSETPFDFYAGGEINLPEKVAAGFTRLSSIGGNLYPKEIEQWFQTLLHGEKQGLLQQSALDDVLHGNVLPALKKEISEKEQIAMGVTRAPLGNE
ncbi:dihydrodipicolinate synthase family protein [Enterococcus saccharolyticus]|uniref:dihydrodipicolinate synthase family protein n=1 Tax=Enterococcus saccharolyticus TaxID=41997 RepID=UPI0039E13EA3